MCKQTERETLDRRVYFKELFRLQGELVKLQDWVQTQRLRVVVIFEGRDSAGKGGAIKRITQRLNPRVCRVAALPAPNERERTQWYFQRYAAHLPAAGEIVLFDRSWYNRAGVERVMGFCTEDELEEFFRSVPEFERMLVRSGIVLVKYWFSVSDEEQERRFQDRINNPEKRRSCSSSLTDNQYLTRTMPERSSMRSNCGHVRMNSSYSSCVQKPMTCSTPARLYQLRSKITISPAAGKCSM
jgi:polyphosphate kinase 2